MPKKKTIKKRGRPKKAWSKDDFKTLDEFVKVNGGDPSIMDKPIYKAILEMAGNRYEGKGKTLQEAISAISLEWQQIKAKGIVTITCGDKKCEKVFFPRILRRIFVNKIAKQIWIKNLALFLK